MKWKNVRVERKSGETVYEGPFNELPLKEDYIVEKSVELYKEPEPCIIYRTHIRKKFYLEVIDYMEQNGGKEKSIDCAGCRELIAPIDLDTEDARLFLVK